MVGGDFIVSEGLKGGEQIIVNGMARPGMPVKIVAPAAADKAGPSPVVADKKEG
jgi:membrane fusion protein (multidrug efflux system)